MCARVLPLATLAAGGAPSEEVFAAATEEVGRLLLVDYASMSRFESDRILAYVASWSGSGKPLPPVGRHAGEHWGNNVNSLVFETGPAGTPQHRSTQTDRGPSEHQLASTRSVSDEAFGSSRRPCCIRRSEKRSSTRISAPVR